MADDYSFDTSTTGLVTVNSINRAGGTIEVAGDKDLFKVSLTAGTTYVFDLVRFGVSWLSDPLLQLYSPTAALVAQDDDSGIDGQGRIVYTAATSGTHYLGVMDFGTGTGQYNLYGVSSASSREVTIGALRSVVSEGDTVTFIASGPTALAGSTFTYTLSGVSATDFTGQFSGQFMLGADGHARISVPILNDGLTEGVETLTIGTDIGRNLSVTINDTSRPPVNVSAAARNLVGVHSAFYGSAPTSSTVNSELSLYNATTPSGYAADVAARFASTPNLALAGSVLNNLGVTATSTGGYTPTESYNLLRDALNVYFTAFPASKGQVVLNVVNLLANLERDPVWGQAAIQFNSTLATRVQSLGISSAEAELVGVAPATFDA